MTPIPPLLALAGGALIGLSAALYVVLDGRVAGISGQTASLLRLGGGTPFGLALAFLVGLPLGALVVRAAMHSPAIVVTGSPMLLILGGLLVGFGTRLGNGCTSGHGVCGLARLSPRSAAAVATFMLAARLTVFVARHVVGAGG